MNKLYEMYEVSSDLASKLQGIDFCMFAAHYDNRSYKINTDLESIQLPLGQRIIFNYHKFIPTETVDKEIYDSYKCLRFEHIFDCTSDGDDVNCLIDLDIADGSIVGIDISSFSIPDLFKIIYLLKEIKRVKTIYAFYNEPDHYHFENGVFTNYEYLQGERKYQTLPGYYSSGDQEDELLVLFLGYDKNVAEYVRKEANTHEVIAINGFPAYILKSKDWSLMNNYDFLTNLPRDKILSVNATNPFLVYNSLVDIKNLYPNYILNLCVLGSKPMALGACVFSLENSSNVKVTYPYPQHYNTKTSRSSSKSWCYIIEF